MELIANEVDNATNTHVLPPGWQVVSIGELFEFKNGLNKERKYFGYGTPIINYMDVYKNRGLLAKDIKGKVFLTKKEIDAYDVKKGDVLFTRTSEVVEEIGLSCVVLDNLTDTVFSGFVLRARPKNQILIDEFKQYCFSTRLVRRDIISKATYTTRALTNGRLLGQVKIAFPQSKKEQMAIATALSDGWQIISSLEQLIVKKKNIRLGTIQALLTGKIRPEKFQGERGVKKTELALIPSDWISCNFCDVMSGFSSGQTPYREVKRFYQGNIPWITSGELNYNVIMDTAEKISEEAMIKTNLRILPKGTFLFAITGLEAQGTRGSCAITGIEATTNQSCMALFPDQTKLLTEYLFYFYLLYGDVLAFKYCQGTKQQSYTASIAKKLPIYFPSDIEEQRYIVNVLRSMDSELLSLEHKLKKQRELVQGLMQNLLSAKIRLV
ncbi:restriction endonuclease subunit S [Pseudochryseolinea flava]|uniref:Restriction endonuclease subunit S n=1 Tax=Pseudochryseolinea flava TaxID=2059302 RepID=A0A364Y5Q1_9BACT|nr:restriction endonuclease subunit S [Pseudochryseolinea flava]RAW01555.1 restriction endonuclease subunit S [Pseudochryseolinea flava]